MKENVFSKYRYASHYKKLLSACFFFYFCTMAIKLVYSVQLVEIVRDFQTTKTDVSTSLTLYYFIYAAAQMLLSVLLPKINVKRYVTITTILSAISFGLIGVAGELWQLWLILGLNGIFQSASWGVIPIIIGKYFPDDTISYSIKILAMGFPVSNAVAYAISAFFVQFFSWKLTFVFFAVLYVVALFNMLYQEKALEKVVRNGSELYFEPENAEEAFVVPEGVKFNVKLFVFFLCVTALFMNILQYGMANWIPNLLTEIHAFPPSLSILITFIMPLIALFATVVAYKIFDKTHKVMKYAVVSTFFAFLIFAVLIVTYDINMPVAILLTSGARFLVSVMLSATGGAYTLMKFKHQLDVGRSNLALNAMSAAGAGVAPFVTGAIMDASGWRAYYIFLTAIALLSLLITAIGYFAIKKKKNISDYI